MPIKSVKIVVFGSKEGKVNLSNDRYAENSSVVRVDIYKRNVEDETLYMVPVFYYQIFKEKIGRNVEYSIMWKHGGDGSAFVSRSELLNNYKRVASLPLRSVVKIVMRNGSSCFAYTGGCSSGQFELYSLLGDNSDLLFGGIISNLTDRCRPTISTIKSVKVHSVSVLGKIY